MASYNTTANVVLTLNGKQAGEIMASLERKAEALRKRIDAAATAGDKATMKKLQRELNSTKRTMDQLSGSAIKVNDVLRRLDSASPRELNAALRQLRKELQSMERGTDAWEAHVRKIRALRTELNAVNGSLREQQSAWSRFNGWLNNCQTAILGLGAGLAGLVVAGKEAVKAFADMDQEMANVRKFTGMDSDQVAALNEEFKKMDTRTSREELNQLAQQAGRLGKSSQEDVLGFVRAADKINVALDDLGQDATLTLSKLTGIFGDEERLGTEKALLSVGSVINELSQNCSASAPYIAEFASRMGGVGAQAGMTVQQIMGFAAVLDSNNQAVEASSTALSQVITRIYQEPAKYAQVAGLDVQRFSELVKTDMNGAIIELLSALNKAGGMDVLSPMFKDMGESGARAVSALSTLSKHIEDVKSQQEVANVAFREATSINKESDVQNNTVQAGLEKAGKSVHELAVELGEKLQPVMSLFNSSAIVALKVLNGLVDFFIKYRGAIVTAVAALVAYKVAANLAAIATAAHTTASKAAALAQRAYTAAVNLAKAALLLFTGNVKGATVAFRAFSAAIKANPVGALAAAITSLIGLLGALVSKYNDNVRKMREQREHTAKLREETRDYSKAAAEAYADEIVKLNTLYKAATNEALSRKERIAAANQLLNLYPDTFAKYKAEGIMLGKASAAYRDLAHAIMEKAKAQAAAELYQNNFKRVLQLEQEIDKYEGRRTVRENKRAEKEQRNDQRRRDMKKNRQAESLTGAIAMSGTGYAGGTSVGGNDNMESTVKDDAAIKAYDNKIKALETDKNEYQRSINFLESRFAKDKNFQNAIMGDNNQASANPGIAALGSGTGGGSNSSGKGGKKSRGTEDKFKAEKLWREKEEALIEVAYAKGEKDYEEYTGRMDEIAVQFYEKQLEHTDLGETERLKIQAQYYKAKQTQDSNNKVASLKEIEDSYAETVRNTRQFYLDGLISKETYDLKLQEAEMDHQRRLSQSMDISEEERLKAADRYAQMRVEQQTRLQEALKEKMDKLAEAAKQHEEEMNEIRKKYFGLSLSERQNQYASELARLNSAYSLELKAAQGNADEKLRIEKAYQEALKKLRQEHGLESDEQNDMEKAVNDFNNWLESDGGKALTGTMSTVVSGMSSIFSQLTSSMQADLEIQTASINRRYDKEISLAEGNSYKVAQLEKRKEAEIAAAKNEANKKMFAMQIIQAVAQTAQNALSAYGSAAAIPVVGYVLAPIAAAMALAAGALQVAAIKKQAQASEAQGYAQGGFTPSGPRDREVGVVHAGEWVASQKLVNNPQTRTILEALDYAQRTNTVGSITAADVSRSVTAPVELARSLASPAVQVRDTGTSVTAGTADRELQRTIRRLTDRLEKPFYTVNSVTGEDGMHKAQKDYERLIANKSPRNRK